MTGETLHKVLKSGEPDYYARRNNRVFIFEFKDVRLDAKTKTSCNYETIRKKDAGEASFHKALHLKK